MIPFYITLQTPKGKRHWTEHKGTKVQAQGVARRRGHSGGPQLLLSVRHGGEPEHLPGAMRPTIASRDEGIKTLGLACSHFDTIMFASGRPPGSAKVPGATRQAMAHYGRGSACRQARLGGNRANLARKAALASRTCSYHERPQHGGVRCACAADWAC